MSDIEKSILTLKTQHSETWQEKSDWFWLVGLLEEVGELILSLLRLHRHPPEIELAEISTIAMNWLEKRARVKNDRTV